LQIEYRNSCTCRHLVERENDAASYDPASRASGSRPSTALLGCDKALKALELQAKVEQLIQTTPIFNIHLNSEWIELRTAIIRAVEPHPEARESFLKALTSVSDGSTG
jgi:hypothetical protein